MGPLTRSRLGAAAALLLACVRSAWAGTAVVTLTFDDGIATQVIARDELNARGLKGTFYVNSAMLGTSGFYLTLADLRGIAAAGHEIGGHTLHHPHLPALSLSDARTEICGDRDNLLAMGFSPVSFAYPFGEYTAALEAVAQSCGYRSARRTSGIMGPIPPVDPYAIPDPDSVHQTTTLADLQALVGQAEAAGQWLPITFHHICDGCSDYSIARGTFTAFLDWLAAQRAAGRLAILTTAQVMSGSGVGSGPPPPPPPPPPAPAPPVCAACAAPTAPAYPNPWRADRDAGRPLRFSGLAPGSVVLIYSLSGRKIRTLEAAGGAADWDLRDDGGGPVPSGYYVYRVSAPDGRRQGTLAVVK